MDDLLREFLIESNESLDVLDVELVRFEQEPNNAEILGKIFRLVHTIKGTCGFIGLPRLEALAHAAETLMSKFRDGAPVTGEAVTLVLFAIDRIKELLTELETHQREPEGADSDLIYSLEQMTRQSTARAARAATTVPQESRGALRPGEVSLEELERAFQQTPGSVPPVPAPVAEAPQSESAVDDEDRTEGAPTPTPTPSTEVSA